MSAIAGRVMPLPKGEYDSETTYRILDIVSYGNATYMAKTTTTGNLPTNTSYWQEIVSAVGTMSKTVYDPNNREETVAFASDVTSSLALKVDTSDVGSANGVASLDTNGKVPSEQLPTQNVNWDAVQNKPSTFPPSSHTHTKSDITDFPTSMTPTAHNQSASTISAGTLGGKVLANATAEATLGDSQVRNIYAGTTDMTAGTSNLATGSIYIMYE